MQMKKGISLIVLVITIIVMVVLAGTIILNLTNDGIIDEAGNAVESANLSTIADLADLGWLEARANGAKTVDELKAGVDAIFEKNKIDVSEYGILVTEHGVTVKKGWLQDGLTVRKGDTVLTIGDNITYDQTAGGTVNVSSSINWKVLGASDSGELLILSASHIKSRHEIGDNSIGFSSCQNDWLTAVEKLDAECEPYGKGKKATGARSIRIEDIDKISGYDKTKYAVGALNEYGNEVTISYNGTTKPSYTATNGLKGDLTANHNNGFNYYNGTNFAVADLTTKSGTITTLKSTYYKYNLKDVMDTTTKAYSMLVSGNYWLASPFADVISSTPRFGVGNMSDAELNKLFTWYTEGSYAGYLYRGVRAVVSLAPDVELIGSSSTGWTY